MRLRSKISLYFVALSLIPLSIVGYFSYVNGRETIEQQTFHHLGATNLLKASDFTAWMDNNLDTLQISAQRPLVRQLSAQLVNLSPQDSEAASLVDDLLTNHLIPTNNANSEIIELFLASAETGEVLASTDSSRIGTNLQDDDNFQAGILAASSSEPIISSRTDLPSIYFSTPVFDFEGNSVAVLIGIANMEEVSELMRLGQTATRSEDSYLVNSSSNLLTQPRFGSSEFHGDVIQTEGTEDCIAQHNGSGVYQDYRGEQVVGVYRWLPDFGLCLLTEIDQQEALAPVQVLARTILIIAGLVAAAAAALGVYFSQILTQPLQKLEKAVVGIGEGNLDERIDIHTQDEIGQLAATFNEMLDKLKNSLSEAAYGRSTISGLNRAGQDLQRVRETKAIYRTIADEISRLGYKAVLLGLSDDETRMRVNQITIDPSLISVAEKLTHKKLEEFRLPINPEHTIARVLLDGKPVFVDDLTEVLTESLPGQSQTIIGTIMERLGLSLGILAPISTESRSLGMLAVVGEGLSEQDVMAIGTFANQAATALENAMLINELADWAAELENRVTERTERLQQSNEELEQFAYVASHDLQEPLRTIVGFLQLIEQRYESRMDEEGIDFIQRTVRAANRMQSLIQDLLHFSRIDRRGRELVPVDSGKALESAIQGLEYSISTTGTKLVVPDEMPEVMADETQLSVLFQNLISNAIKFKSSAPPVINISVERDQDMWKFSIKDNGIGIDPQYNDRIFLIFQRLHGREDYEGTGIGLAVSKKIILRHGGQIWVESQEQQGSTFNFTLMPAEEKS